MFKKGEKVVYPRHGAGKIIAIEKIGEDNEKYYKIKFFNSSVLVSVPVKKAEEMGLRRPMTKKELTKALRSLGEKIKITKKTLVTLDAVSREKLASGKVEDMVYLVNLLKSLAKQKEEENKNFSYSYSDRLEIAHDFLKSEIELVMGKNAIKKYPLFSR